MSLMRSRNKLKVTKLETKATKERQLQSAQLQVETSTLERILAAIPEGRITAISYVRQLSFKDGRYREFIKDYDTNKRQDLGELCRKHEIAPQDFLADINREAYPVIDEAMRFSHSLASSIVAARLPKVVHRGLIEGAKADGIADRHFTLQKEGFHVAPKGVQISMNQVNQSAMGLPSFEDETKELASILSGGVDDDHLLAASEQDYIDAEEIESREELREEQLA